MKKIKYIAFILILALGIIGGAYAYWTDSTEIDGTVSTGSMTAKWEDFFVRDAASGHHSPAEVPEYVTAEAFIDPNDSKKAVIIISNLYPSGSSDERVAVTGHVVVDGTIPSKFDEAVLTINTDDNDVADWVKVDMRVAVRRDGTWTVLLDESGVALEDVDDEINKAASDVVLQPGDAIGFGDETLYFYLDSNAPNSVQGSTLEFEFEMKFKQFNM